MDIIKFMIVEILNMSGKNNYINKKFQYLIILEFKVYFTNF